MIEKAATRIRRLPIISQSHSSHRSDFARRRGRLELSMWLRRDRARVAQALTWVERRRAG
jgi:hypothetical protein